MTDQDPSLSGYSRFVQKYGCPACWVLASMFLFGVIFYAEKVFLLFVSSYNPEVLQALSKNPDQYSFFDVVIRFIGAFGFTTLFHWVCGKPGQEKEIPLLTGIKLGLLVGFILEFAHAGGPATVFKIQTWILAENLILGIIMGITLGACRMVGNRIGKPKI